MTDTIGILIPTYNRVKLLKKCINSIFKQTYKDFVIYIYDDGSTDDTVDEIRKIKDSRIIMISNPENKGVAYARNRLLNMCSTDYACWQDDDDLMNRYRLETQYNILKENPGSYVIGNCKIFRDEKEININEKTSQSKKEMGCASIMFRTKKLYEFNEDLKAGEDSDWIKRLKLKRIEINQICYYIRYHNNRLGLNKN